MAYNSTLEQELLPQTYPQFVQQNAHPGSSKGLFRNCFVAKWYFWKATANLHVVCSISKQPSESDGVGYGGQIDEENGRQGLDVECIVEVASKERCFPLDVFY